MLHYTDWVTKKQNDVETLKRHLKTFAGKLKLSKLATIQSNFGFVAILATKWLKDSCLGAASTH